MKLVILLISATALLAANARPDPDFNPIRLRSEGRVGAFVNNCESWRLASEVNNFRSWKVVPEQCVDYVKSYMTVEVGIQTQYEYDVGTVVLEAIEYLNTVSPAKGKNDTWLFDLTDTLLSSLPYYSRPGANYGGNPFNETAFNEYIKEGNSPLVPNVNYLYKDAQEKGFKIVILSGISEDLRPVVEANLNKVGFAKWDKLILKYKPGMPTKDFKASERAQLKKDGFKVIGNVGDQWSDLLTGTNAGKRAFKIPNALYYS
ncbi:acid phosphatase 1-like [Andrographis paniculata]|uniref:acid phosphatase 1-like n=1 Tax=Andrographis paniculata TaxID=175694 RepID=UPI0021E98546|nr:acid phosphatase 1-like [Andrographis paniculata]